MSRVWLWVLLSMVLFGAKIPATTQQLLVVSTSSWSASSGTLQRYTKNSGKWKKVGRSISVKVGKNGLAWGRGVHYIPKGAKHIKREGDGRAPAGVFRLPYAFGDKSIKIKYPYRKMSRANHCVDDSRSRYYNKVIDSRRAKKDYKSFEYMKFASGLYSYGIFVDHNPKRISRAGSCIFMHIKKKSGRATVGCTAMSKSEIIAILKWLDPKKKPLLVQAPKGVVKKLWR